MRSLFLLLSLWLGSAHAVDQFGLEIHDQEMGVTRFEADGAQLVLWFASGLESNERIRNTAARLAQLGVEVWAIDLAESLFLPQGVATLRDIDGRYVAGLIAAAHTNTGKTITVLGRGYDVIPVLRGVREWQLGAAKAPGATGYLDGVVLFSPELYAAIPALGQDPIFEPIAAATNVPIMLYQASKHGNRRQLDKLLQELERGGATVYVKVQAGVTGLYYHRDNAPQTLAALEKMPAELVQALQLLQRLPTPLDAQALTENIPPKRRGLDTALATFKGNNQPPALDLYDAQGRRVTRRDYHGKVTVVNFWATWCPPCVEEIPSLNHLRELMADQPFELISVNYAEQKQDIQEFLKQVQVDFPVLLDSDGQVAQQWKVLIFPSTFVIGPDGRIAYGVNGAIHWDSPELVAQLKGLLH